jgi:hypothetical protein
MPVKLKRDQEKYQKILHNSLIFDVLERRLIIVNIAWQIILDKF